MNEEFFLRGVKVKPKITVFVDSPNWCHDAKCEVFKYYLKPMEIAKVYQDSSLNERTFKEADLLMVFYWLQVVCYGEHIRELFRKYKHKLLVGVSSESIIDERPHGDKGEGIEDVLADCRGTFGVTRRIHLRLKDIVKGKIPVYYCPNGVRTRFFVPRKTPREPGPFTVGWAGNANPPRKRFRAAREIVTGVEGAFFKHCGRGEAAPQLGYRMMPEWYQSLDAYICTASSEGMPNPVLEAASCGVPVISTPVGDVPEFIRDGGFIIGIEDSYETAYAVLEDALDKVKQLRDNLNLRREMGRVARERALEWDWEILVDNYRRMFKEVAYS